MAQYYNEKILLKHLKKRTGSNFHGASQELLELFEATGMMSIEKKQKANLFSLKLRNQIKPKIKNGTIKNIEQLDKVIDAYIEPKKHYKSLKGTTSYTIERTGKKVKTTVTKNNHNLKKASYAMAGGMLYGTPGAIAGHALAGDDKGPTIKNKVVSNDFTFTKSYVKILSNMIEVRTKEMNPWDIFFNNIQSIRLLEESKSFEHFEVILNDNTHYKFKSDRSNLPVIPKRFRELQSSLDKHKSKSFSTVKPEPKSLKTPKSQQDPFTQIKKLGELLDSGLITNKEFESKKKELLNKI